MQASRIFIVEDEVIVAHEIAQKLKKMGHDVIGMTATGEQAVEVALREKPDLILMDIKLKGGMDGIEAASKIHAQASIPLIYLTALSDEETLQRAKITEPFAYIQKPITSRELHIAVEIALYKHAVQKELSTQLQRMTAMRLIDQAIINSHDLQWTMRIILDQVAIQLEIPAVAVILSSPFSGMLEYFQAYGFRNRAFENFHLKPGKGFAGQAFSLGKRLLVTNLRETNLDDERLRWMLTEGYASYVAVPLFSKDRTTGVLELFSTTPLNPTNEWLEFLDTLAQQAAIAVENVSLISQLSSYNLEILQSYNSTIFSLSAALEMRDNDTQGHSQRVTEMTLRVAREMGFPPDQVDHIRRGALLHDIGKVGIPDAILLKPGPLTDEEWAVMRRHPQLAHDILSRVPFLRPALEIPLYHHERWDGSGYPFGLKGEKIPLAARIFAVVDVWDALLSDRPYRAAWTPSQTREYLRAQAGVLFDPKIVDAFLKVWELEEKIAQN
jgi:response regulator RpfG family c-di-GMP phosphodiesterase